MTSRVQSFFELDDDLTPTNPRATDLDVTGPPTVAVDKGYEAALFRQTTQEIVNARQGGYTAASKRLTGKFEKLIVEERKRSWRKGLFIGFLVTSLAGGASWQNWPRLQHAYAWAANKCKVIAKN